MHKKKPAPVKPAPVKPSARKPAAPAFSEIGGIIADIKKFRDDREWAKFHDAKNVAICLSVEAGELLEAFLWKDNQEVKREKVREELADVFYSAFLLADQFGWDVGAIVREKLAQNAEKYPIAKAKGSKKKYDEI